MSRGQSIRSSLAALAVLSVAVAPGVFPLSCASGWAAEDALSISSNVAMNGIGPVKIGMTVEEIRRLVGPIEDDKAAYDSDGCYFITPLNGPDGVLFMILGGRVARIDITNPAISTERGIRIGASEDEIAKAYGKVEIGPHFYGGPDGHYVRVAAIREKLLLLFETQNGIVATYRAGETNAVNFVEGCL
jgi:hypothetical protein